MNSQNSLLNKVGLRVDHYTYISDGKPKTVKPFIQQEEIVIEVDDLGTSKILWLVHYSITQDTTGQEIRQETHRQNVAGVDHIQVRQAEFKQEEEPHITSAVVLGWMQKANPFKHAFIGKITGASGSAGGRDLGGSFGIKNTDGQSQSFTVGGETTGHGYDF